MSMFRVTTTILRAEAEKLKELNEQFKSNVEMLTEKENSLSGMWEGEARNAFHTAYSNDKVQFDNFYRVINEFVNRLQEDAAAYDKAESIAVDIATKR